MITAQPRVAIAVGDFAAAVETFRNRFGMPVADFSDRTVPELGAHVGMCVPVGGSNIELMGPANPDLPLSQALQKFLDRRGDGLYALMLEAPDPNAEADELAERGLDVLPLMPGAGGRDVHPRSTSGVLIRVYPDGSVTPPDDRDSQAPGLSGIVRTIVGTTDVGAATKAYGYGFGLAVGDPAVDTDRGVEYTTITPPTGGTIELVAPVDETRPFAGVLASQLAGSGPGLFALVLSCADPVAARGVIADRGVAGAGDIDPAGGFVVHGTRFILEAPAGFPTR